MIDYALTSLQPVAHQPVAPTGLLYTPGQDIAFLAFFGFVALMSLCLMPGQARESIKELWAPVGAFLRSLCCPWLWEGLFIAGSVLCVLRALYGRCQYAYVRCTDAAREQLRRLAFSGYMRPVLT